MVAESLIRIYESFVDAIVIASVFVFSLRLCFRIASFLASRPWRRHRTFTFRPRWRNPANDPHPPPCCAVCLRDAAEGEKMRRLTVCGHCFHADCIDTWLSMKSTCPLCRAEVPPLPPANPLLLLIVPYGVIEYITKNGTIVSDS
ncbi:PREDICTED: RING-H2 finger protein ATL46-like [Tarenaya hassleriana]|uniref:RING-H2 finger protein ATL46-like n=1 Tax=Tarenaya hassleriana TaxID=28532 RepID=UPI00053C9A84|nr:PREDICTED: RING-H2 finger protein ATL46-like [Tarenaya hassleriana]XP_010524459.1 PREDICTED: RING-H2 finger protein ATL46-like [Tarenaya hassleriana]